MQLPGSPTAPGHPRFRITREQLEYLRSLSFSWTDISRLLGMSRMTIHRRRDEYGLLSEPAQAITDAQLGQIVRDLRTELPDIGQVMVAGPIKSNGLQIAKGANKRSCATDPLNTALRCVVQRVGVHTL